MFRALQRGDGTARVNPTSHLTPYLPILILLLIAGVMCLAIAVVATVLGPRRRLNPIKDTAFECGSPPAGSSDVQHQRHSVKFYLVALLFIVFDVESVFIYPWASLLRDFQAEGLGWFAYFEMLSFMATLALGLVYVWRKGALEWA
jgi:NADH-quinone oxidoreductase subunit A